jgi:copper(I)-binding protein
MSMAPIRDVAIPAGEMLEFKPGGKHVMVYDIGPNVRAGDTVPVTLSFASGRKIEIAAKVAGAGDAAPN